jgi:undecaprenyl-diphosphatase
MTLFQVIVTAIVEGITEFLPVSSTGHMIITERILGIESTDFTRLFTVGIQLGAILAVVLLYWKRFVSPFTEGKNGWNFYLKLIIAVIPALLLGFLFSDKIDTLLDSPLTVAISMVLGGIVLLFIDRLFTDHRIEKMEQMGAGRGFIIGIWQCIAMIPGVSRSAASIIGGMQQKLSRKFAAEFSFFLAVPTMAAATGYKLFKGYDKLSSADIKLFAIGNLVAFVVAILAIKFFIGFLQRHGFRLFGWYRIIAGIALLILLATGVIRS